MMKTEEINKDIKKDNSKYSATLVEIPESEWPDICTGALQKAWRSKSYLVQQFQEDNATRLSINRTLLNKSGNWKDRISWDELQDIKRQVGFGDCYAVEVYPADKHVINVANIRHLWILKKPLPIGWSRNQ